MTIIANPYKGEPSAEYPREKCCFFTGHRDYEFSAEGEKRLVGVVRRLYELGVTHFYAGGALGFDLAAEIVTTNLKNEFPSVTLSLALPFDGYVHGGYSSQAFRYVSVLRKADELIYVSPAYDPGAYTRRNVYMADRSDICVAYLTKSSGGTYSAVNYAQKVCRKVYNVAAPQITVLK